MPAFAQQSRVELAIVAFQLRFYRVWLCDLVSVAAVQTEPLRLSWKETNFVPEWHE